PGEEYPGGALPMIKEGAMENPKVDAVIGLHEGVIDERVSKGKKYFKQKRIISNSLIIYAFRGI
ncbi:MAG: hypothetical protein ACFNUN_07010, partial [Aggregatibacter sp.]|uniref:hypothetical protein n=1 Tax=Aggregatibacter sp. TaxID=1872413 RepID=UPI0036171FC4